MAVLSCFPYRGRRSSREWARGTGFCRFPVFRLYRSGTADRRVTAPIPAGLFLTVRKREKWESEGRAQKATSISKRNHGCPAWLALMLSADAIKQHADLSLLPPCAQHLPFVLVKSRVETLWSQRCI